MKTSVEEITKIDMNGIKANARIRVELDVDLVLKNMMLKFLGQPHDEVLITRDKLKRYKHYKANEDGTILKDNLLFMEKFGETGSVKYYQFLIPKQIFEEELPKLHGDWRKHPGITKTMIIYKEINLFPKRAQLNREWVMSCEQYIRESRTDRSLTRPPLQNPNDHFTEPENAKQIDIFPELPLFVGYENLVTAMDVFSRYFFA